MSPECPGCGEEVNFPPEAVGRKIKCSGCGFKSRIHETDGGTYYLTPVEPAKPAKQPAVPPSPRSSGSSAALGTVRPSRPGKRRSGGARKTRRKEPEVAGRGPRKMATPASVMGAASVSMLQGAALVVIGIVLLKGASTLSDGGEEDIAQVGTAVAAVLMLIGAAFLALSLGLLKGNGAARVVAMILAALGGISGLVKVAGGVTTFPIVLGAGVNILVIALLLLPESSAFFASGGLEKPKRPR